MEYLHNISQIFFVLYLLKFTGDMLCLFFHGKEKDPNIGFKIGFDLHIIILTFVWFKTYL